MSQVFLASYKGTSKGIGGLADRFIRFITKGTYSHSEICIGNPFDGAVMCVTSAGTEGGVVGRVKQYSREEWDITPLPTVYAQEVLNWYNDNKGKKYDWVGCVRSILPFFSREHETKWFCSEAAATIIGFPESWRMHPSALYAAMNRK